MNARKIAEIVVHASGSPFNMRRNDAVVENVSWGMFGWGEADLIALTRGGYLIEGEIKISKPDLIADKKKSKWQEGQANKEWLRDIKQFYYIVPEELVSFAIENTNHGVIGASISDTQAYKITIHRAGIFNRGRKLFMEEKNKLLRLGCMRAWRKNEN